MHFTTIRKLIFFSSQSPATIRPTLIGNEEEFKPKLSVITREIGGCHDDYFKVFGCLEFVNLLALEDGGITFIRNVRHRPSKDAVSHFRTPKYALSINYSTIFHVHLLFCYCFKWLCWVVRVMYESLGSLKYSKEIYNLFYTCLTA
jgi:hypothetical protein